MRKITHLVIHCTATVKGEEFTVNDVDLWHRQKGYKGIGYHYVISADGTIKKGREEIKIGAHTKGYNRHSIGIAYVGGLNKRLTPKDTRTRKQKRAMKSLLLILKDKYPEAEIVGHRDFYDDGILKPFVFEKVCPCFNVKKEYNYL